MILHLYGWEAYLMRFDDCSRLQIPAVSAIRSTLHGTL